MSPAERLGRPTCPIGRGNIGKAKEFLVGELMGDRDSGVVAIGIGQHEGKNYIAVSLSRDSPEVRRIIPSELGGFKVEIAVIGPIRAFSE